MGKVIIEEIYPGDSAVLPFNLTIASWVTSTNPIFGVLGITGANFREEGLDWLNFSRTFSGAVMVFGDTVDNDTQGDTGITIALGAVVEVPTLIHVGGFDLVVGDVVVVRVAFEFYKALPANADSTLTVQLGHKTGLGGAASAIASTARMFSARVAGEPLLGSGAITHAYVVTGAEPADKWFTLMAGVSASGADDVDIKNIHLTAICYRR